MRQKEEEEIAWKGLDKTNEQDERESTVDSRETRRQRGGGALRSLHGTTERSRADQAMHGTRFRTGQDSTRLNSTGQTGGLGLRAVETHPEEDSGLKSHYDNAETRFVCTKSSTRYCSVLPFDPLGLSESSGSFFPFPLLSFFVLPSCRVRVLPCLPY
jgi:hypothetical protein